MDSDEFPFEFRSILMKSQTSWTHSILCFIHVVLFGNPCKIDDYKDLNQGDRSESYKDATEKCDGEDLKGELKSKLGTVFFFIFKKFEICKAKCR